MPFVEKRLISPTSLTTSASTALYTVPTGYTAIVKQIVVTNTTGTAATFTMYIGAASAGNALFSGTSVAANDTVIINLSQVLGTGEILRALSGTNAALNLTVSGVENDGPLAQNAMYIADNAITSAKIADGAIVNADINASAAIAVSKLASASSGGQVLMGGASGAPTYITASGDVTIDQAGVTAIKSNVSLTGTPLAPTAAAGTNTTQLATTAFANAAGGMVFVAGATFSGASSFDVTGFTSTYLFYELRINVFGSAGDSVVGVLYSGATARNSTYYGSIWYTNYLGSSGIYGTRANGSSFYLGDVGTNPPSLYTATITGISNSAFNIVTRGFETQGTATLTGGFSNYAATNSYDKIRFSTTGGATLGGSWTLMGVRKS
jgi:hypothetical protein